MTGNNKGKNTKGPNWCVHQDQHGKKGENFPKRREQEKKKPLIGLGKKEADNRTTRKAQTAKKWTGEKKYIRGQQYQVSDTGEGEGIPWEKGEKNA